MVEGLQLACAERSLAQEHPWVIQRNVWVTQWKTRRDPRVDLEQACVFATKTAPRPGVGVQKSGIEGF